MSKGSHLTDDKTQARVDPYVGVTIDGRFEIVHLVGSGGMGRVYRANQKGLNRPVALKILDPPHGTGVSASLKQRFLAEASMTAKLHHPNTVTVIDYGATNNNIFYIAFEFLEGRTLAQVLASNYALPWPRVLLIAQQIARSLREAHKMGVVHRDLKPANIMLLDADSDTDLVKVLDFGLVKAFANHQIPNLEHDVTQAGMLVGSPTYMSPEQGQSSQADPRSDLYALGVLMYEALSGSPPFHGSTPIEVILKHINYPVPPLHVPVDFPLLPAAVENLIMRCLSKEPEKRPGSMDEFLVAIQALSVSTGSLSSSVAKDSAPYLPNIDGHTHASSPPHFPGQRSSPPHFPGQLVSPPYFPGQRSSPPHFPGQLVSPPHFPGQRSSPPHFPGQRSSPPHFPGQRSSPPHFPGQLSSSPHFPVPQPYPLGSPQGFVQPTHASDDTLPSAQPAPRATLSYISPSACPPPPKPQSTRAIWISALFLGLLAVASVWLFLPKPPPAPQQDVLLPLTLPPLIQKQKYPEELFEYKITSKPAGAAVFLDDMKQEGVTPLEVKLPMSQANQPVKVRLELNGYQTLEFEALLDPHLAHTEKSLSPLRKSRNAPPVDQAPPPAPANVDTADTPSDIADIPSMVF